MSELWLKEKEGVWKNYMNCTIVLLLLKMVEQYSNTLGSGITFLGKKSNSTTQK
jgi:hypothetical protein